MWFKETVSHKKKFLSSLLKAPLEHLAHQCAQTWESPESLTRTLQNNLCKLPHCQLLYAIDMQGHQLSANITRTGVDNTWRGQNLSARPFLQGLLPFQGLTLSAAYLSQRSMQPCLTALQAVRQGTQLLGFIAADFHIKDLPNMGGQTLQRLYQVRHETNPLTSPARNPSPVDQNIDTLNHVLCTLMQEHGIFHCALHFVSACACLWSLDSPLSYQVHGIRELLDPQLFERYPKRSYDSHTRLELDRIPLVFAHLKALRQTNDKLYLRSGSINIINGQVGLSFSSEGSRYMRAEEFLNHDLNYWLDLESESGQPASMLTPN